jgi:HEPN domain-containing protein
MPPNRREEVDEWLRIAAADLTAARLLLSNQPPLLAQSLFHAQQTVEKALKAYLVASGKRYPLTHDISELLDLCMAVDETIDLNLKRAARLSDFAVLARYPGETLPTADEAMMLLEISQNALDEIRHRIHRM